MKSDWVVWQLLDSAFPMGGFAHSGGLEAAWQAGEVRGSDGLKAFLRASLWQVGQSAIPLVIAAARQPERIDELDQLAEAILTNHIANRASRAQGQALVAAGERIYQRPEMVEMRRRVRAGELPGHLAPTFGWVMGMLGITPTAAAEVYLFTSIRSLVSAGVRLGIVGPLEGQRLQHEMGDEAIGIARQAANLNVDDIAQTAPLIDLFQGTQDRLYSRLFQS